jgi:alcohol oxidase
MLTPALPVLEYPFSRGETHIVSPDPYEAPDFDAGFMNDERDMAPMVWGYIKSRQCHYSPASFDKN